MVMGLLQSLKNVNVTLDQGLCGRNDNILTGVLPDTDG